MPNPVAVNDLTPISGSLQTSRISYGVETAGKNYGQNYNGTTWYSDIPNGGEFYTIISDNYTANYYISRSNAEGAYVEGGLPAVDEYSAPVFWITAGTSSLDVITIVNGLPDRRGQIPFNSGSQALNWVASSSNYFAVGPDYYAQIDADNLIFCVEGNQVISYPTTGSTWYDLSGWNLNSSTRNVTLYNSPTFNTNGWFTFDGTDDYGLVGTIPQASSSYVSITTLVQRGTDGWNGALFGFGTADTSTQDVYFWGGDASRQFGFNTWNGDSWGFSNSTSTGNIMDGRWHHLTAIFDRNTITNSSIYVDGVLKSLSQVRGTTLTRTVSGNFGIGLNGWNTGDQLFRGNMANMQMYPKVLTAADVAQNYYGGPIVTSNISGLYNAGNLVSFAPGTTATYNMVSNTISGSLQNGVSYSPTNGGYWRFDGVDDRILLEGSTTNAWTLPTSINWTVNAWIRTTTTANGLGQGSIFSNSSGGPVYSMIGVNAGVITYWYYNNAWLKSNGTISVNDGNWHMLTWVNFAGGTMNLYVDGVIDTAGVNSSTQTSNALDIIGASWAAAYQGDIASLQINKEKAFTAAEVQQQYNATK
jgi:hypothetical protein